MAAGLCSYRVKYNVTTDLQKVAVLLNKNCFKAPLEEMANAAMSLVVGLGIYAIELPHSFRQISIGCFNHQVIVVVHQAIGMANPVKTLDHSCKRIQEKFSI